MTMKQWLLPSLFASTCLFSLTAGAAPIENYSPVTADRLKNPEPFGQGLHRILQILAAVARTHHTALKRARSSRMEGLSHRF